MKKIISIFLFFISIFFSAQTVFAGPDITLSPKTSTANSVTVTIKNNGPAGTSSTGTANSIFDATIFAVNPSQHPDNSAPTGPIVGGQSKDITIPNLNPGTQYSIEVQEGGGFYSQSSIIKKINVSTNTSSTTPVCISPKVLVNGTCITPPSPAQPGTVVVTTTTTTPKDQCHDNIDNDKDGKADQYGVDLQKYDGKDYGFGVNNGDGVMDLEPDPSCFSSTAQYEVADDVVSSIIPCTDKCTFSDVFKLINNLIKFFFTKLLIPIFVIILMYAGFKYITAEGNPSKIANLKKILGNIVLGIVIMLCAWLIVRTIMNVLLNEQFKKSGVEFLGN